MIYFVKAFGSREAAMAAQYEKGFPSLALYNGIYYHFALDAADSFYAGMVELDVDESEWALVKERPKDFKLARYVEVLQHAANIAPTEVDYIRLTDKRLHKVLSYGPDFRVIKKSFYAEGVLNIFGDISGSDLVIEETFVYTIDVAGFARQRVQTIHHICEDGTVGYTSLPREKFYDNVESREEGRSRRRNVIDQTSMQVAGMIAATHTSGNLYQAVEIGVAYMSTVDSLVKKFIETSDKSLYDAIAAEDDAPWMDNVINGEGDTIRMYLLSHL